MDRPNTTVPPPAVLTEQVDARTGVVRATGVLTRPGADLLCGAVETLGRLGHRRVTLDLTGVHETEDDGLLHLAALCDEIRAGSRLGLTVRRPAWHDG